MLPLKRFPQNVTDWNPGVCSEIPLEHPNLEEVRVRAYLGIILGIPLFLFHTGIMLMTHLKRNVFPLTKRDNNLVIMSGVSATCFVYATYGRDVIGVNMFTCEEFLVFGMIYIPMQIGPTIIRLVNIRNRILWNLEKDKINFQESLSENVLLTLQRLKRQTSAWYTFIPCCILMAPSFSLIGYHFATSHRFLNGCLGCELTNADRNVFTVFGLLCCIIGVLTLRRLKKVYDDLPEYNEIKTLLILAAVFGASYTVTAKLIHFPSSYDKGLLLHCCGITIQYYQGFKPVVQAIKLEQKRKRRKIEPTTASSAAFVVNGRKNKPKHLIDIIETNEGLEAFTEHVTKEYNVENIKFWHDVVMWKRDYTLNRASPTDLKKRAFNIFSTYVPDSALLQVNLDNSQRETLEKDFAAAKSDDQLVVVNVFDEAEEEILNLMIRDSYPRFKASPAYEKFVAEKWPTAEDW